MKTINRPLIIFSCFTVLTLGCFAYNTWAGNTFWADQAQKNTEYGGTSRPIRGLRFYHK